MLRTFFATAVAAAALLVSVAGTASASTHYCPHELHGQSVLSGHCPSDSIQSEAGWAAGGRQKGHDFVVWGPITQIGHGTATLWCPRYDSIALAGHHWGIRSTSHLSSPAAREQRDPRGARGMYISWGSASPSDGSYQSWIVCRGYSSTFINPRG